MPQSKSRPLADAALDASTSGQVLTSAGPGRVPAAASTLSTVAILDKGGTVHNCKSYGAVGDGVAADRPAIQAAISACSAAGGGTVLLPPGTYAISQEIVLSSNVHLRGSGRGKTKVVLASGNHSAGIQMAGVDHASVRDLTLDVRTNSPHSNGITIQLTATDGTGVKCTYCTIENCEVLGWDTHMYLIWCQGADHSKILFNWIDGNVLARPASSEQEGIEIQGGTDTLVLGNTVTNVGNSGIDPSGVSVNDESGTPTAAMPMDDVRVIANSINGANVGLFIGAQWNATSGIATARRIKFLGNTVQNCGLYGFWAQLLAGSQMTDVLVQGNTFDTIGGVAGSQGVFFDGDLSTGQTIALADCNDVVFANNLVRNVTDASSYGIRVENFPGVRVLDNTVRDIVTNAAGGIVLNISTDGTVRGNRIANVRATGITVEGNSHRAIIVLNEIRDWNTSNAGVVGILVQSSNRCVLTHNKFYQSVPANDFYTMGVQGSCDRTLVHSNSAEYSLANAVFSPNANSGTNPSSGTITVTAGVTSKTVTNGFCTSQSRLSVRQVAGAAPIVFYALPSDGAFVLRFGTATVGDEQFGYDILN